MITAPYSIYTGSKNTPLFKVWSSLILAAKRRRGKEVKGFSGAAEAGGKEPWRGAAYRGLGKGTLAILYWKYPVFLNMTVRYSQYAPIQVHNAMEEERRKWEVEKVEAVQVHCGILEEQNRKSLESMRSEMQREKSKALALQNKAVELKTVRWLRTMACDMTILINQSKCSFSLCMIFFLSVRECRSWRVKAVHSRESRSLYWLLFVNHWKRSTRLSCRSCRDRWHRCKKTTESNHLQAHKET